MFIRSTLISFKIICKYNMSLTLKDLCRLCAQKDELSKDLLDDNNKNVLKLVQDFVNIIIYENDDLPSKICLNCEDKMVSFQLFILECSKVQETLKKLYTDSLNTLTVKLEDAPEERSLPDFIKTEVKVEMTAEDIVSALNNEANLTELEVYEDDDPKIDNDDNEDYLDDIAIASLKEIKRRPVKKKELTEQELQQLSELLKRSNLKVKDFVKFECEFCEERIKTWNGLRYHYIRAHKTKPILYCLCGYEIGSKSVLYKHVSDHKLESRKLRKAAGLEDDKYQKAAYKEFNAKDFVTFKCTHCQKECSSWYTLRAHSERVHKVMPIVQCSCGIILKSKSVMYKHIQDHKNPNVLACDKCPRITKSLAALNKHKMRHVPKSERKFYCASCEKVFNSKDALKSHEKSHIPIDERKVYNCEICNMGFTTRSSAASHKRVVHDKIKAYVCDLCGYACGTNGELRQHRAIHSDDKPFVCNTCSKPFKTYSNLKTHMDTHEETSYECYICRRVLNSRRTLRKHLLVHEDMCRHVCSYCNKAFKRRQTLKVHMYTHTGDKPLTCKWCDERFAYASTLRSHRLRCHPDKVAAHAHDAFRSYDHSTTTQNFLKDDNSALTVEQA